MNDFIGPIGDELWGPSPRAPAKSLKKKRRATPKHDLEGAVQQECLLWLCEHPLVGYIERRNTGVMQFDDGTFVKFGAKGAADVFCIVDMGRAWPQHVEIECKRRDGKGRLSPGQKVFKQRMADIGIPYLVVTSAEDLSRQFKEWGLTKEPPCSKIE